jgi:hypothetical protein
MLAAVLSSMAVNRDGWAARPVPKSHKETDYPEQDHLRGIGNSAQCSVGQVVGDVFVTAGVVVVIRGQIRVPVGLLAYSIVEVGGCPRYSLGASAGSQACSRWQFAHLMLKLLLEAPNHKKSVHHDGVQDFGPTSGTRRPTQRRAPLLGGHCGARSLTSGHLEDGPLRAKTRAACVGPLVHQGKMPHQTLRVEVLRAPLCRCVPDFTPTCTPMLPL